jgi:hypothetical protein
MNSTYNHRPPHLLVISHAFPPSGGAGVRRILKTIKFFEADGWLITVIAPRRGEYFAYPYEPISLAHFTHTRVIYTTTFESILMRQGTAVGTRGAQPAVKKTNWFTRLYQKIYRLGKWIAIPESSILWLPSAVLAGLSLSRHV